MRLQNWIRNWGWVSFLIFCSGSHAESEKSFRTPARLYAGAYSIKIQLKKDLIDYDVPVWVKPDQAQSTLDPVLMRELGYSGTNLVFDEVKIAGHGISKKKFSSSRSEWAFVPDFSKSCCHGVLGQDILQNFILRFDPVTPVHLEWTPLDPPEKSVILSQGFQKDLGKTFSLKKISLVPFSVNLREGKVSEEGIPSPLKPLLFTFDFIPPDRNLKVLIIQNPLVAEATKIGLKKGEVITRINGERVSTLDRWQLEKYLSGSISDQIELISLKNRKFRYDFKENQFQILN